MKRLLAVLVAFAVGAGLTMESAPASAGDQAGAIAAGQGVHPAGPPGAAVAECDGRIATIVGTRGDDTLRGTRFADVIAGLGGNDRIFGLGGDDVLCGGDGADVIVGHDGADVIVGGGGPDRLLGKSGADVLEGNGGDDVLLGGGGADIISAGAGNDIVSGGPGDDTVDGGSGDDRLKGRAGADRIDGGPGVDVLRGGDGLDVLVETPGEYPHPRVGLGTEGWVYLADEFTYPCENTVPHDEIAANAALIVRIVEASGRTAFVTLAPGKDAIHPEHLGDLVGDAACAAERRSELRVAFAGSGIGGWINLWGVLRRRAEVEDVYYPLDSHWTTLGGLLASKAIINRLEPGLFSWGTVRTREVMAGGAQGNLLGITERYPATIYRVKRGEVEQTDTAGSYGPNSYLGSSPDGVIDVDLLVLHDSFGNTMEDALPTYVAESTWVHWGTVSMGADRLDRLAGYVADHEVLVIESSERGSYRRFGEQFVGLAPALIRALSLQLPATAIDLQAVTGDGWTLSDGSIIPVGENPQVVLPGLGPKADG
ncbi:hypothetical protein HQ535_10685, partial [bacterium]|nr:hypothetical protein [bacterium]